jgi:hypothetical protein
VQARQPQIGAKGTGDAIECTMAECGCRFDNFAPDIECSWNAAWNLAQF